MMGMHVLKFDRQDGEKLEKPIMWCGHEDHLYEFAFVNAQHVALSVGGSIQPCKSCVKAIIKELEKEL